jgi:DNA invertase Pin-like site-specific DNA recombinase
MKQYIYYNKSDKNKEPQGKIQADNITEAIEKAAAVKQMNIDSFLSIFDVKTDGKRKI